MAERAETHDELDRLLRQGVADIVEGCPSAEGTWSKIRSRIEREGSAQTDVTTAVAECRRAAMHPSAIMP